MGCPGALRPLLVSGPILVIYSRSLAWWLATPLPSLPATDAASLHLAQCFRVSSSRFTQTHPSAVEMSRCRCTLHLIPKLNNPRADPRPETPHLHLPSNSHSPDPSSLPLKAPIDTELFPLATPTQSVCVPASLYATRNNARTCDSAITLCGSRRG